MANLPQLQNDVLAILFAAGDPFEKDKLARVLDIDLDTLQKVIERINEQLASTPFVLLELDKSYQMTTREEFASVIRDALQVKNNAPLSQAAMEVLAAVGRRTWDNDDGNGCTVHSAIYNLTDKTMVWVPNENYDDPSAWYTFSLNP